MIIPSCIGVAIEPDRFSVVFLKIAFRDVRFVLQETYGLPPDGSEADRVAKINSVLKELVRKERFAGANIYVGVPRQKVMLRFLELPAAVSENLAESIAYEIEKYIPFPSDEISYDYQVVSENRKAGTLSVLLAAVKKEEARPYHRIGEGVGAYLAGIDIIPNALVNALSAQKKLFPKHYLLVSASGDAVDISGVHQNRLIYSKWKAAEHFEGQFHEVIRRELSLAFSQEVTEGDKAGYPVLICGGNLRQYLDESNQASWGGDIRTLDLAQTAFTEDAVVPAYGLAAKGLHKVAMDVNLLPADLQKKPGKAGFYAFYMLTAALILSGLLWAGSHLAKNRMVYNRLTAKIEDVKTRIADVKGVESRYEAVQAKLDYLDTFSSGRGSGFADILNELSLKIPESAWIYRLDYTGRKVEMEGLAENASDLIPLLESSAMFNDAAFLSTIRRGGNGKENFTIGLEVNNP